MGGCTLSTRETQRRGCLVTKADHALFKHSISLHVAVGPVLCGAGTAAKRPSGSGDRVAHELFTARDRANPLRCACKLFGYLLLSPCILTYMFAEAAASVVDAICECTGRLCSLCCGAVQKVCICVTRVVGTFVGLLIDGCCLVWEYTVGKLLTLLFDYVLRPLHRLVLLPLCHALSTACAMLHSYVLQPIYRGVRAVCCTIYAWVAGAARTIHTQLILPLYRALLCVCRSAYNCVAGIGRAIYRHIVRPIHQTVAWVAGKIWAGVSFVCRGVWRVVTAVAGVVNTYLCSPVYRLVVLVAKALHFVIVRPIVLAFSAVYKYVVLPVARAVGAVLSAVTNGVAAIFKAINNIFAR